jgi:hypothetical protein
MFQFSLVIKQITTKYMIFKKIEQDKWLNVTQKVNSDNNL